MLLTKEDEQKLAVQLFDDSLVLSCDRNTNFVQACGPYNIVYSLFIKKVPDECKFYCRL